MVKNSQKKFQKKIYVYASRAEIFFPPSKHSIGTTVMDFERIFHVPFFFHLILPKRAVFLQLKRVIDVTL